MNIPVTRDQMEAFKADSKQRVIGGKTLAYIDELGKEHYYPNRSERKSAIKQSKNIINNRKPTSGRANVQTIYNTITRTNQFGTVTYTIKQVVKRIKHILTK